MLKDSELAYINENGQPIHGTTAFLHRVFGKQSDVQNNYDKETELREYKGIIQQCGYADY